MANRVEATRREPGQGPTRAVRPARRTDAEAPERPTLEDEIRLRAYYRYLERERDQGDAMSDWLEAEFDVLGRHATGVDADEKTRADASP